MKILCSEFVVAILGLIIEYYQHNLHSSFFCSDAARPQTIHSIFIFTDLHRVEPVKMFPDTLLSLVQTSPYHHCFRFPRFVLSSLLQSSSPPQKKMKSKNKAWSQESFDLKIHLFIFPSRTLVTLILITVRRCFLKFDDKEYWLLEVSSERRGEERRGWLM